MVRRVITGPTGSVVSDVQIAPITVQALPGHSWHRVWSADAIGAGDDAGPTSDHFPPPGGIRFNVYTVPPHTEATVLSDEAIAELDEKLPGRARHMRDGGEQAGMHATASIDFVYVAEGAIDLELAGGETVHLRAGDTVVQDRAAHAWRNRSDRPCTLVICLVGLPAHA